MTTTKLETCPRCEGHGGRGVDMIETTTYSDDFSTYTAVPNTCPMCKGKGKIIVTRERP